jgi:hypothetical protein
LGEMRVWVDGSRPIEFDYDDKWEMSTRKV